MCRQGEVVHVVACVAAAVCGLRYLGGEPHRSGSPAYISTMSYVSGASR